MFLALTIPGEMFISLMLYTKHQANVLDHKIGNFSCVQLCSILSDVLMVISLI